MKIAVIGAGNVGSALGRNWAAKGHDVVFGVRGPQSPKMSAVASETGAAVAALAEAAAKADIVVLALPWGAAEDAVKALGPLTGKIVVDCMNPLAMTPTGLALERGFDTSGAETVASWLPAARIVKAFNQVGANVMADASGFPATPVMFVAGDDDGAKIDVMALAADLGFEALDAGDLSKSRILEPFALVWINQAMMRGHGRDWAFGAMKRG